MPGKIAFIAEQEELEQKVERGEAFVRGGRYRLDKRIGSGGFGTVNKGIDVKTNRNVAIKMEPHRRRGRYTKLRKESVLYKTIAWNSVGMSRVRWYGVDGAHEVLVMDLLGPDLGDLFESCACRFSLKTVLMLADQMLKRLEYLHSKHVVHCDVKPDNFAMGIGRASKIVHVLDFGLARWYCDKDGKHVKHKIQKHPVITARFASLNAHAHFVQSRRDDLVSLGYTLIYFLRGSLPWQGLNMSAEEISYAKVCTSIESLCEDIPDEFATYQRYCQNFSYDAAPDYEYLTGLFRGLFRVKKFKNDKMFDWMLSDPSNAVVKKTQTFTKNKKFRLQKRQQVASCVSPELHQNKRNRNRRRKPKGDVSPMLAVQQQPDEVAWTGDNDDSSTGSELFVWNVWS